MRFSGRSALNRSAAMYSAAARWNAAACSPSASSASGASRRAAAIRTRRTGSDSSGRAARRSSGESCSSTASAALRTSGLESASAECAAAMAVGSGRPASRSSAPARAIRRLRAIGCDPGQGHRGATFTLVSRREGAGKGLIAGLGRWVMLAHRFGCPFRRAVLVTRAAGVRHADRGTEIRAWNAEAVVVPGIDDHVRLGRHVTRDALAAGRSRLVEVMARRLVLRRQVALAAHLTARRPQLGRVWLMAVAAGHTGRMHPARQERTPVIDLVALLTVRMIETRLERHRAKVIEKRLTRRDRCSRTGRAASGIARRRRARVAVVRAGLRRALAGRRVDRPRRASPLVERNGKTGGALSVACEPHMLGPRPVT